MDRLVPAATQLLKEITDLGKNYKVARGDPDGFGYIREITFDARTSNWLVPILDALVDERIRYIDQPNGKGRAKVRFVNDTRADRRQPFDIAVVDQVLNDETQ